MTEIVFLIVPFLLLFFLSIRHIKRNYRIAVFRFGVFTHILEPGWQYAIPFIEETVVVNLDKYITNWESLSANELDDKVKKLVCDKPKKSYK